MIMSGCQLILDGSYVCLSESCEFSKTRDSFVLNCSSGSNSAGSKNGCSVTLCDESHCTFLSKNGFGFAHNPIFVNHKMNF